MQFSGSYGRHFDMRIFFSLFAQRWRETQSRWEGIDYNSKKSKYCSTIHPSPLPPAAQGGRAGEWEGVGTNGDKEGRRNLIEEFPAARVLRILRLLQHLCDRHLKVLLRDMLSSFP